MNLRAELTRVREKIAEPSRQDETNAFVTDIEIINWIYEGEMKVMRGLVDDALWTSQKESTLTLTGGSAPLPADFMRHISLQVQAKTSSQFIDSDLIGPKQLRNTQVSPPWRPTSVRPYCYIFAGKIYVLPASSNAVKLRYVYRPNKRYKTFRDITTTPASTTVLTMTNFSTLFPSLATNYFVGCELELVSGSTKGETNTCTASSATTVTVTTPWSISVPAGTIVEGGEMSVLPVELYPLYTTWAAYLAFMKDRETDLAQLELASYTQMLQEVNERYKSLHRAEPNTEMPR